MQAVITDQLEHLADNLAKQGFAVDNNFLSEKEVGAILEVFKNHRKSGRFKKAGIGRSEDFQIDRSIRGDYIKWIEPSAAHPDVVVFLNKIQELVDYLNKTCFLGIKDYEAHFTVYPPGAGYERHVDQFQQGGHRKLSFICYLNQDWNEEHGGQLRIFTNETHIDVLPTAGKLACFLSEEIEHEVLPATRDRRSLTGWMLNQFKGLDFLP